MVTLSYGEILPEIPSKVAIMGVHPILVYFIKKQNIIRPVQSEQEAKRLKSTALNSKNLET